MRALQRTVRAGLLALALGTSAYAAESTPTPAPAPTRELIAAQAPDGIDVERIEQEGRAVKAVGTSKSNALISNFLRKLDTSGNFDAVELVSILATKRGGTAVVEFQIHLRLK
jgi:hypothetical protein